MSRQKNKNHGSAVTRQGVRNLNDIGGRNKSRGILLDMPPFDVLCAHPKAGKNMLPRSTNDFNLPIEICKCGKEIELEGR